MNMDFSVKDFNVRLRTIRFLDMAIAIIIAFILTAFTAGYLNIDSGEVEYIIFFVYMMVFFAIASYGTRGFTKDIEDISKPSNIFKILMIVIPNMTLAFFIQAYLSGFDSMFNYINLLAIPLSDMAFDIYDSLLFIIEFFSAVIIAPISEELFFRGVLFNRLKINKGVVFALVVSSIIFGLCHINYPDHLAHVIYTCLFGMCLCILYLRTDNLLLNMVVHSFYNLLSYLIVYTPLQYLLLGNEFGALIGLMLLASLIFIPVYIIYFTFKLK